MKSDISFSEAQQSVDSEPLILAVEDNEDNLLIVNYVVDSLDCKFIGEMSGEKTLIIARNYRPDLILLDIMLPDINGIDVFRQLQLDPITKSIPVIAVTALAMLEEQKTISESGFDGYITKPYLLEDLEDIIRLHIPKLGTKLVA
ncbi:response regulator [Mastigocoleus testarum]|uniref:Response regulator receiver protein n=1 Tax=Mastigocoleus testarum BC008 TaxID=371196 RepID=A0A0V7ZZN6_9CYAN|nr:response regulator [Mastigocoleus testarum]KST69993.1 response regulator receiver protein [Mastigocoleus testarum BC008]